MNVLNDLCINNAPMNADQTGTPIGLPNIVGYAVQAEITGNAINGEIKLQASCDPAPQNRQNNIVPTHWTDIKQSPVTLTEAGDITWNVLDTFYTWMRVVYTDNSGGTSDGVLNVRVSAKGV